MESDFKRILVVGLGLMGGSFAKALRQAVPSINLDGLDLNRSAVSQAVEAGILNAAYDASDETVYDLVVLATPLGGYPKVIKSLIPRMAKGALVTDLGSVKERVHQEMKTCLPESVHFLGGHPMSGSEQSGFEAARADLFRGKVFFLTGRTASGLEASYEALLVAIGAQIVRTSPQEHDTMVAKSSHIPHLTAVLLSSLLESESDFQAYIGDGFRDSTRIAAGDPKVWRDIFLYNATAILEDLEKFQCKLNQIKACLQSDNGLEILQTLDTVKRFQEGIKE